MPVTLCGAGARRRAAARPRAPLVAAKDELVDYRATTPGPRASGTGHWVPSPNVAHRTSLAIAGGWAASTRSGYAKAWDRFDAWCTEAGVPHEQRFPATEPVICAFAASRFGTASGAAARNDIAGVRAQHVAVNAPWPSSPRLRLILEGVERNRPAASLRQERIAVGIEHLRALADALPPDAFGQAILAAACVAFWGQFRLGELLTTSARSWNPKLIPTRAAWVSLDIDTIHLPWTKTMKSKGARVPILPQESRTCPVSALSAYTRAVPAPSSAPLFCYPLGPAGALRPLTKRAFLTRVNTVFRDRGLPEVTGHCFRIGGTTELLSRGVSPDIVRVAGRWLSDSHLRYWRNHDAIVPQHVRNIVVSAGRG